jgi:Zn-dependent protease with chaperone function
MNNTPAKISAEELSRLKHSTETTSFNLAMLVVITILGIGLLWLVLSFGGILLLLGVIVGSVWLSLQLAKAHLISNNLRVSKKNFPEIYAMLQEVTYVLDYHEKVDIYIVEDGAVNAFLAKFFDTKFIILNSELVKDMLKDDSKLQLKWVIARFVGGLKAKHDKVILARVIIDSIEKLKIFNLLLLPYERAIHYSADQIGLAVCGDLEQSLIAFQKFMVGNDLARMVGYEGILEQKNDMGFFAAWIRLFSSHPHTVDRYVNLLNFAQANYQDMYNTYYQSKLSQPYGKDVE